MYEDEESKVQNILEEWWIRVDDLKQLAISRHVAVMRTVAKFAGTGLNRIFGKKILSVRVIAVSGCLSLASLHFVGMFVTSSANRPPGYRIDITQFANPWDAYYAAQVELLHMIAAMMFTLVVPLNPALMHIIGVSAIIAVILSTCFERLYWLPHIVFATFIGMYLVFPVFFKPYPDFLSFPFMVLIIVAFGVACDVMAVAFVRILLRLQADWMSLFRTLFAAILQLLMSICLLIIPIAIGIQLLNGMKGMSIWWSILGWAIALSPSTNLLSAITTLAFFGAASILIMHRLIWPFITRPLYRLARVGVFRTSAARSTLFSLGLTLIIIGTGKSGDLFMRLLSILGVV